MIFRSQIFCFQFINIYVLLLLRQDFHFIFFSVESPSSSASGVDNLNNLAAIDKMDIAKDASTHVMGNHVIAARNRPNFVRLLDFVRTNFTFCLLSTFIILKILVKDTVLLNKNLEKIFLLFPLDY